MLEWHQRRLQLLDLRAIPETHLFLGFRVVEVIFIVLQVFYPCMLEWHQLQISVHFFLRFFRNSFAAFWGFFRNSFAAFWRFFRKFFVTFWGFFRKFFVAF